MFIRNSLPRISFCVGSQGRSPQSPTFHTCDRYLYNLFFCLCSFVLCVSNGPLIPLKGNFLRATIKGVKHIAWYLCNMFLCLYSLFLCLYSLFFVLCSCVLCLVSCVLCLVTCIQYINSEIFFFLPLEGVGGHLY